MSFSALVSQAIDYRFTLVFRIKAQSHAMGKTADTKASWNHAQVAVSLAEGNLLCPSLNTRGTKFNVNWMPKFSRNWRLQTLATRRNITKVRSFYWTEINIMFAEKYRWDAVDCSIQEPLACNSDDEKCIKRAVKESKALKLESKKPAKSRSPLSALPQEPYNSQQFLHV